MVTGYGSNQGFKAVRLVDGDKEVPCSNDTRRTRIASIMLNRLRDSEVACDDELTVFGLERRVNDDGSLEKDANGAVIVRSRMTGERL